MSAVEPEVVCANVTYKVTEGMVFVPGRTFAMGSTPNPEQGKPT